MKSNAFGVAFVRTGMNNGVVKFILFNFNTPHLALELESWAVIWNDIFY